MVPKGSCDFDSSRSKKVLLISASCQLSEVPAARERTAGEQQVSVAHAEEPEVDYFFNAVPFLAFTLTLLLSVHSPET